ncbi:MAG: type II toxin-antitoxin system HicA family toxin [Gemmatimonadota bacterium]|nr:type II toxin-antitoxin system HicA family toxin [Gemmatimonadota bacterium]
MPRLRRLSGDQVVRILAKFGFRVHSQRGSHIKLRRTLEAGTSQTLTVPRHRELDIGTLNAIMRQASRFIPEDELRREFYTD